MKVVGYDDELVKQEAPLLAVVEEAIHEQGRHAFRLQDRATELCGGCDEECAYSLWSGLHCIYDEYYTNRIQIARWAIAFKHQSGGGSPPALVRGAGPFSLQAATVACLRLLPPQVWR